MAAPQPVANDYSQPPLPTDAKAGWKINCVDLQVVTKSNAWNQDSTKRATEFAEIAKLGPNYIALAVPYDDTTKYGGYVTSARAAGFKIWHRSHWNHWEGDNGTSPDLSAQDYLDNTYDFIVANPSFFQAGDLFGMCVECNNANDKPNTTYPFRTGNVVGGAFDFTLYNQFLKDQVRYANAAFKAIGLERQIHTWPISMSVSLLNLGGQSWTNTSGDNHGLGDSDIVTYFAGRCTIDHYESDSVRDGNTYYTAYNNDITKWGVGFPLSAATKDGGLFIGEIGYHTTTSVQDGEQLGVFDQVRLALQSKTYIIGMNWWVHMGSSTASIFKDTSGAIVVGGRKAVDAIKLAFSTGNSSNGKRPRV